MPHLIATLSVFSGRPNPRWHLTEDECASLLAVVKSLAGGQALPDENRLGYRGVRVSCAEDGQGWSEMLVGREAVAVVKAGGATTWLADPARAVERLLLASAVPHAPDVVRAVRAQAGL